MPNKTEQSIRISENEQESSATPAERLQALHEFAKSGANDPDRFISAALHDNDDGVRCAAIAYLSDLATLESLLTLNGAIHDAASLQYHKILAGALQSKVSIDDRIQAIAKLDLKSVKQVALLAKCKEAAAVALTRIKDTQDNADLCLFAASVYVRKSAAEKIEDRDLISELLQKTEGKDKTVFKVLSKNLATLEKQNDAVSDKPKRAKQPENNKTTETKESESHGELTKQPSEKALTAEEQSIVLARFDQQSDELEKLYTAISKLSYKNTKQLNQTVTVQKKLKQKIAWPNTFVATEAYQKFINQEKHLLELKSQNKGYQEQLADTANELVEALKKALDEGNFKIASQLWDKIQGKISNTGGKLSQELTEKTNEFKAKIQELKDWKNFAATEKKKELIVQMQHLLDSKMHPSDKSKHINKLHREWKLLGHSSQNEKLWRQFKTSSDKAYEPCKEFFKQQKQVMADNYKQRVLICDQLETYVNTIDQSAINLANLKKVETKARDEWKQYAPVENSKIKQIQKRFYGIMDQLRKIKRTAIQTNVKGKKALIAQAEELVALEDNREAMNKAKSLQSEWKQLGPSSYKDDKKYWEAFRSACDKIFAKRDDEKKQAQEEIESAIKSVHIILDELDGILNLVEDEFREARKLFSATQRKFREALSPSIRKERKQLLSKFDNAVAKIENRFNKLPDKKLQQARLALADKAALCRELESTFLACKDDDELAKAREKIDESAWSKLGSCSYQEMDRTMESRFTTLKKIDSVKQLHSLIEKNESEVRNRVVGLEIKANLESPEADKNLRMQVQLDQLKANFGRSADNKENGEFARTFELEFLCLGPIENTIREEMEQRVKKAIDKLV